MTLPPLQPDRMPLQGRVLIEASAGTGKTFSITTLYLRLLLERGLSVDRILVVTFTRAATEELAGRIRERLGRALRWLEQPPEAEARRDDPELARWLKMRPRPEEDRRTLRIALAEFDQAAIFTIHGYCQRMLQEHAFETGVPFDAELVEDETEHRLEAARDVWRLWFQGERLPEPLRETLLALLPDPKTLLKRVGERLGEPLLQITPPAPPLEEGIARWQHARKTLEAAWSRLRARAHEQPEVARLLGESDALNRKQYSTASVEQALEGLARLCSADGPPPQPPDRFELLTPERLARATRKGRVTPDHPLLTCCGDYHQAALALLETQRELGAALLRQARTELERRLEAIRETHGRLGFDDLLRLLYQALERTNGDELARLLQRRHPVALIDEFQDTDTVQYRIFSRIYRGEGDWGLFLIGDPKQAIYRFRGGDIQAYLEAARQADHRFSLDTNWRSGTRLVEAVNRLFSLQDDPFLEPEIHYQPVQPSPKAEAAPLQVDGEALVPLQFWLIDPEEGEWLSADDARARAAEACARHIAWLLQPGRATLGGEPLQPRDIALLVRTHKEAEPLRQALRRHGLACVALGRDSVFETEEARALQVLLAAVIRCEDERLLRYALGGALLQRSAAELLALQQDETAWSRIQDRFFRARQLWQERGFIQAFQFLLFEEGLAARLLASEEGERRLTNLLHLAELLQEASSRQPGLEELLHWLEARRDRGDPGEAALQRLESDEGLVRIVTMHASKGLEYPVVYLPFPWSQGQLPPPPWFLHDDQGRPMLYLGEGAEDRHQAIRDQVRREQLAERLRLFYVAVTRARRLCILPWARVRRVEQSAPGWLLYRGRKVADAEALAVPLHALANAAPGAVSVGPPPAVPFGTPPTPLLPEPPAARPFPVQLHTAWRVTSYSALERGRRDESADFDPLPGAPLPPDADPVQQLPAGSAFGRFIHRLLEELDFTRADEAAIDALTGRLAPRFGLGTPTAQMRRGVIRLVLQTLQQPLPGGAPALARIHRHRRLDELEFFLAARTDLAALERLLARWPRWAEATAGLASASLQGLVHGFIDLVFEHQGRYHLVDYKSNRLDTYDARALETAMQVHHYPLQALFYALALHRHLAATLPNYDPEQHFGGIHYLFLRGMGRPGEGCWQRRPEPALLEALDRLFTGEEPA